jgi:hypothetical protein
MRFAIREEVDPDANIIVDATFDESLEGIIRVSVVATGLEIKASSLTASAQRHGSADVHEAALADLAQRLEAENARQDGGAAKCRKCWHGVETIAAEIKVPPKCAKIGNAEPLLRLPAVVNGDPRSLTKTRGEYSLSG